MERTIDAPDSEFLTDAQAAAWLGMEVEQWHQLVNKGIFPKGIPYRRRIGGHVWPWMDVIAVGHLLARGFLKIEDYD
jgi:hypothetical protein